MFVFFSSLLSFDRISNTDSDYSFIYQFALLLCVYVVTCSLLFVCFRINDNIKIVLIHLSFFHWQRHTTIRYSRFVLRAFSALIHFSSIETIRAKLVRSFYVFISNLFLFIYKYIALKMRMVDNQRISDDDDHEQSFSTQHYPLTSVFFDELVWVKRMKSSSKLCVWSEIKLEKRAEILCHIQHDERVATTT